MYLRHRRCNKYARLMAFEETREELEKRLAELARKHAETRDEQIKRELEELSRQITAMKKRLV